MLNLKNLKTPCFLLDKNDIRDNVIAFQKALDNLFTHSIIGYSVKTNSLPYILYLIKEMDCYAEVVSYNEYSSL